MRGKSQVWSTLGTWKISGGRTVSSFLVAPRSDQPLLRTTRTSAAKVAATTALVTAGASGTTIDPNPT